EHDRLLEDGAREQLTVGEVVGPGGDVPRVAQIRAAHHFLLAVEKLALELCRARHRVLSIANQRSDYLSGRPARSSRRPRNPLARGVLDCLPRCETMVRRSTTWDAGTTPMRDRRSILKSIARRAAAAAAFGACVAVWSLAGSGIASAQDYPTRP